MNAKVSFSQYIKKDELGQYHILVAKTTYVVEAVYELNNRVWSFRIIKINRLQANGDVTPVEQTFCFEKGWLIRSILRELNQSQERIHRQNRKANAEFYAGMIRSGKRKTSFGWR